jgi:hypothetical protein
MGWVVSFTPRPLCRKGRSPVTHWISGWAGPWAVLDAVVKRKIPRPRRESNQNPDHPARSLVVIPNEISRVLWILYDAKSNAENMIKDLRVIINVRCNQVRKEVDVVLSSRTRKPTCSPTGGADGPRGYPENEGSIRLRTTHSIILRRPLHLNIKLTHKFNYL